MNWVLIALLFTMLSIIGYVSYRLYTTFANKWILFIPLVIVFFILTPRLFGVKTLPSFYWGYAYSLALLICLFYAAFILDVINLVVRSCFHQWLQPAMKKFLFIILVMTTFGIGIYSANHRHINYYTVNIQKFSTIDKLRVVHLSDLHINMITGHQFITEMIDHINSVNADLIVFTGDILDNRLQPFLDQNLSVLFKQLKSTYGTFAVLGNHEYYGTLRYGGDSIDDVIKTFAESGIHVLRDQSFTLPHTNITIIGRDDYSINKLSGHNRLPLNILKQETDNMPLILLDHQPVQFDEAIDNHVDLMFSGHSHGGQIFPGILLVNLQYKNGWGIYQKTGENGQKFTNIVTSGYGLWGPPIRLFTHSEIVVADITFQSNSQPQSN